MNQSTPPKWLIHFLTWFCRKDLLEAVLGDLEELYARNLTVYGKRRAKILYLWHVFLFFQPFAFSKNIFSSFLMHTLMFRHFLKIGLRILLRQKWYSLIKIGGFSLAVLACMIITLFIRQELTYDQHYTHQDQIYRIIRKSIDFQNPGGPQERGVSFPRPFPQTVKNEYPDFEEVGYYNAAPGFGAGSNEVRIIGQSHSFHEDKLMFADQGLLNILEVPFFLGEAEHALEAPNSIVLSRSRAKRYFGAANPVGKTLILNNEDETIYTITGVMEDPLPTSHLKMEFVVSMAEKEFYDGEYVNWRSSNYPTYVRVLKGRDIASLEKALNQIIDKYLIPASNDANSPNTKRYNESLEMELQPVGEIYMNRAAVLDNLPHGDIRYIWLFGSIGVFILVIALINFINLSTARSANRAKEVGLRKTLGTQRGSLITQFLTESFLICLFSFVIALLVLVFFLPLFNTVSGLSLSIPWEDWWVIPTTMGGILLVSLLAGMYPSFYLSAFQPVEVLHGNLSRGSNSKHVRNGLVIFQFAVTIALLAATWVIDKQMGYMLNKKLGYDREQVLLLQGTHTLGDKIYNLKTELKRLPGVEEVSVSGYLPIEKTSRNRNNFFLPENRENESLHFGGQGWTVDHDYLKAMGMKVLAGRNFDMNISADSQAVIINQSMVKKLGLENPIGMQIANNWSTWTVIGVVGDFHFENMKEDIDPLLFRIGRSTRNITLKLETHNIGQTIDEITKTWDTFSPQQSIRYAFLDESFEMMFTDVKRIGQLFK